MGTFLIRAEYPWEKDMNLMNIPEIGRKVIWLEYRLRVEKRHEREEGTRSWNVQQMSDWQLILNVPKPYLGFPCVCPQNSDATPQLVRPQPWTSL